MRNEYSIVQLFCGYTKTPPKIIYDRSEVMIIKQPFIDQNSGYMIISWAFIEYPWIIYKSSIKV